MKKKIRFLSMDPSMRNTALVWGYIDVEREKLEPKGYKIIQTGKTKKKQVRASSDTISRSRELLTNVQDIVRRAKADVCFAETPSGSQNSSAMKSYGIACTLIAAMKPISIEVTPEELKTGTVGKKTASKDSIIGWVVENYPDFKLERRNGVVIKSRMEHVADALCAAHAGMKTEVFNQLKNLMGSDTT